MRSRLTAEDAKLLHIRKEAGAAQGRGGKNTQKKLLRSVFNNLVWCIKKPPSETRVTRLLGEVGEGSAIVAANRNRHESRLHQAAATVVIIGVKQKPEGKRKSHH